MILLLGHSATFNSARKRQGGLVLIATLMVLAVVAILAFVMVDASSRMIAQSAARARASQARAYADGLCHYALQALQRERQETGNIDTRSEAWAQALPTFPIAGGLLGGQLEEQNGKLNLNALAKPGGNARETEQRLQRLLLNLQLDPNLAKRIVDAIDADSNNDGGAEDASLLGFEPPLRAPNRKLAHISEIAPIIGPEAYQRLAPFISALEVNSPLNVNTASPQVLQSLAPAMTRSLAELMYAQGKASHQQISDFVTQLANAGVVLDGEQQRMLAVVSTHFLARINVKLERDDYQFSAMLDRSDGVSAIRWKARGAF